jgi:hypothetical protein
VRGSDRSKLVDGVLRQVEVVRAALGEHAAVDVRGVLSTATGRCSGPSRFAACRCSRRARQRGFAPRRERWRPTTYARSP